MATTEFTTGTIITSDWLNDVNDFVYALKDIVSAKNYGAIGDGTTDDTAAIQAGLTALAGTNRYLGLTSGIYKVTSKIIVPTKTGLIAMGGKPKIFASSTGFNSIDPINRFSNDNMVIDFSGEISNPYTASEDQVLIGIKIEFDYVEGLVCDGVGGRNCKNLIIADNEIYNFPLGYGLRLATLSGNCVVKGNYIHDFTNTTVFSGASTGDVNITGIDIDDERVNNVGSEGVVVFQNRVENLEHTGTALSTYGNQSDGCNLQNGGARYMVTDNVFKNVNEGIDIYARYCNIIGNQFLNNSGYGIKLIHGARYNNIFGNQVSGSGIAGIVVNGGNALLGNTSYNNISYNYVENIDPDGSRDASFSTGCILLDHQGTGSVASYNTFSYNRLDIGTYGNIHIQNQKQSDNIGNSYIGNILIGTPTVLKWSISGINDIVKQHSSTNILTTLTAAQSIPSGAHTKVLFNSKIYDRNSEFDEVTNNRFTVIDPGIYKINFKARMSSVSGFKINIYKNGSATSESVAQATGDIDLSTYIELSLVPGDYIEGYVYHTTGVNRNLTNGIQYTRMNISAA